MRVRIEASRIRESGGQNCGDRITADCTNQKLEKFCKYVASDCSDYDAIFTSAPLEAWTAAKDIR